MDAIYNKKDAVVILDHSEVRLIKIALDVLRFNEETVLLNESQSINLAGLSVMWSRMTRDINERRYSTEDDTELFTSDVVKTLYGAECSWEVYGC